MSAVAPSVDKPVGRSRDVRFGWAPPVYLIFCALWFGGMAALAAVGPSLLFAVSQNPTLAAQGLGAAGFVGVVVFVLGIITRVKTRRLQPGTTGRGRILYLSIMGPASVIFPMALVVTMVWGAIDAPLGIEGRIEYADVFHTLSAEWAYVFWAEAALSSVSSIAALPILISCWWLVPDKARFVTWIVVDVLIAGAFVAALILLPSEVPPESPELLPGAVTRLVITVLFSFRALARILPFMLDFVEQLGFRPMVAARHLRAKKSDFLAIISVLSISAVMVSSCALSTTLSVMGGFRSDLQRKILGNNAHVEVGLDHGTFSEWEPTLQTVRETDGVVAAAPYVSGEVMVTSASNLAGAVLRGIDPTSVDDVVDLEQNLTRGRLEYLMDPEQLLDLPPEDTRLPMPLEVPTRRRGDEPTPSGPDEPSPTDLEGLTDLTDLTPEEADELAPPNPEEADELEGFLRGPEPVTPARDVLPGIIVGQELARSLRLYVGDEVNVVSPLGELGPAGPMPKSRPYRVAGIFYSGMYEYDMKYTYVVLSNAQRFLNVGDGISGIEIKVSDIDQAPQAAEAIRARIARDDVEVRDWQELNKNLFGALQLEKLAMFIVLGLAILVAGFCVFGTLTLMVQEKSKEVGILKAMGAMKNSIVTVFLLEGLFIGTFGAAIGLGLGYSACFAAEHFGIRMNPEVYYIDRLPVHVDPFEFGAVAFASVLVCLLATIFPAILASRVPPVDALRYD